MSIYDDITKSIIAAIEAGVDGSGFKMPWHGAGVSPSNAWTGKKYSGMNTLNLWMCGARQGFESHEWATFKQWRTANATVKRGSKGAVIVFWKPLPPAEGEDKPRFVLKSSTVFNAEQVDGYTTPVQPVSAGPERIQEAERFVSAIPLDLRFGGASAYYNRRTDHVQLPPLEQFHTAAGYYSPLLHEAAHWTGHESRLDRTFGKRFGDQAYAFEELVAELSAAFLCAETGVSNEPRPDHAEYVAGWLKALEGDSRAIFTAATSAQKATDFLCAFSQKMEKAA